MNEDKEKKIPDEILKEEELLSENRAKTRADVEAVANENEKTSPTNKENIASD